MQIIPKGIRDAFNTAHEIEKGAEWGIGHAIHDTGTLLELPSQAGRAAREMVLNGAWDAPEVALAATPPVLAATAGGLLWNKHRPYPTKVLSPLPKRKIPLSYPLTAATAGVIGYNLNNPEEAQYSHKKYAKFWSLDDGFQAMADGYVRAGEKLAQYDGLDPVTNAVGLLAGTGVVVEGALLGELVRKLKSAKASKAAAAAKLAQIKQIQDKTKRSAAVIGGSLGGGLAGYSVMANQSEE